jgi:hypothetical protein
MRNRVGSLTTRRPGSPSGAIGRRGNIRQSPGMNGRAADVAVANATPPDLHGPRPRESPIGAWATPDNADAATAPKTTQIPGDHPTTALNPHATHLIDPPTTMRLAHAPKPTRRRPEQFKQQPSRRPRRIPIDFSLLIGGTPKIVRRRMEPKNSIQVRFCFQRAQVIQRFVENNGIMMSRRCEKCNGQNPSMSH